MERGDGVRGVGEERLAALGLPGVVTELALTEKQWERQVRDYAALRGWKVMKHQIAYRSPSGWPDLFLVRAERALAMELKSERGKVSPAQEEWLSALTRAGIQAIVARPSDWDMVAWLLR